MKRLLLFLLATNLPVTLGAQTPATPKKQPEYAGDDVKGYSDTPVINGQKWKVHDLERPRPALVKPAPYQAAPPPSDAIVLFDGKDLAQWEQVARGGAAGEPKWKVENGYLEIVPRHGRLRTKQAFGDVQLHVEWMVPMEAKGNGQAIGNSGVELMGRYEIQVLESNSHLTYADGGAGAIYGVWPPLANASRPQGEWNIYDIFFTAPRFEGEKLVSPAYITVVWNGVLVQNHQAFVGTTVWRRNGVYTPHAPELPLTLQDHGQPVRYRNIWVRKLPQP
jgi:hypothetical protein